MDLIIKESMLQGKIKAPPSKSYTHRYMIISSLARGVSEIKNPLFCDDTMKTLEACEKIGADVRVKKDLIIQGSEKLMAEGVIDCGCSGTTLRFFTALAATFSGLTVITGEENLRKRPLRELLEVLKRSGVKILSGKNRSLPVVVFGTRIKGGKISIRGDISSQFISAMIMLSPKAESTTEILVNKLQSRPYVELTLDVMRKAGIEVYQEDNRFFIPGTQEFKSGKYTVEGDFSSAAFLIAAGILNGKVSISGLKKDSLQGDKKILKIIRDMGGNIRERRNEIDVESSDLRSTVIDVSDTPDLAPIYTLLATQAEGVTEIKNTGRLRFKESDRVSSIISELGKMGAKIEEKKDRLIIRGPVRLKGAVIDPHHDHRVAMTCAVAGLIAEGKTVIKNSECVKKSYPLFFDDLIRIGADVS